jgi:hypothetical protein
MTQTLEHSLNIKRKRQDTKTKIVTSNFAEDYSYDNNYVDLLEKPLSIPVFATDIIIRYRCQYINTDYALFYAYLLDQIFLNTEFVQFRTVYALFNVERVEATLYAPPRFARLMAFNQGQPNYFTAIEYVFFGMGPVASYQADLFAMKDHKFTMYSQGVTKKLKLVRDMDIGMKPMSTTSDQDVQKQRDQLGQIIGYGTFDETPVSARTAFYIDMKITLKFFYRR